MVFTYSLDSYISSPEKFPNECRPKQNLRGAQSDFFWRSLGGGRWQWISELLSRDTGRLYGWEGSSGRPVPRCSGSGRSVIQLFPVGGRCRLDGGSSRCPVSELLNRSINDGCATLTPAAALLWSAARRPNSTAVSIQQQQVRDRTGVAQHI